MLKTWLSHPLTRGIPLDDERLTPLRRQIILSKPFLKRIYEDWYGQIVVSIPSGREPVLELGSGAGFLQERLPDVLTSEILFGAKVDVMLDATALPLAAAALRAIVMIDVLHHIPQPRSFFDEAARCIRPGGRIVMIEPWVTRWSQLVYQNMHHEPFNPATPQWEFPSTGPLSGANGALPWIVFKRDRSQFEREFPCWRIQEIEPQMPFRYIVSGGISMRSLVPGWTYAGWRALESALAPWRNSLGMFAKIVVERS